MLYAVEMAPTKAQQPKRVAVIKEKEKSGIGSQAEKYGVRKTQIQSIMKDQMQILADFEKNDPLECKRKPGKTGNEERSIC